MQAAAVFLVVAQRDAPGAAEIVHRLGDMRLGDLARLADVPGGITGAGVCQKAQHVQLHEAQPALAQQPPAGVLQHPARALHHQQDIILQHADPCLFPSARAHQFTGELSSIIHDFSVRVKYIL